MIRQLNIRRPAAMKFALRGSQANFDLEQSDLKTKTRV